MLRLAAICLILGAVLILTSGLAVWLVLAAGYAIGSLMKPRNPHAIAARQLSKPPIPDQRHGKRTRAQRKRDALDRERQEG